jgi:hypothetical protein
MYGPNDAGKKNRDKKYKREEIQFPPLFGYQIE